MGMLISATDLIALYLGLELMSLSLYVIAAIDRDSVRIDRSRTEIFRPRRAVVRHAALWRSLIYGFTGSITFAGIAQAAAQGGLGLIFGLVFLLAGLCFKVSAVPFHMWTPDVYEGAPTPVTAFFAAAPKVAAMAVFVRATMTAFPTVAVQWQQILVFVSIASMALGSFAAIGQTNIKRLLAYSSIGHMGFALVGLAAGTPEGVQGVLIYIAIYVAMTLGTFACVLSMKRPDGHGGEHLRPRRPRAHLADDGVLLCDADVLARRHSAARRLLREILCVPRRHQGRPLFMLAVIGVLTSVVGAYYYLADRQDHVFRRAAKSFEPMPGEQAAVLAVAGLFNLLFFVYPAPLLDAATAAAKSLF